MNSPAVARRKLGSELRQLRAGAGISVDQAAEALECSASKISRLETGVGVPRARDVRDLIGLIGDAAESVRDDLLGLAEEGRAQAWYHEYGDLLAESSTLRRFIDMEGGASEELVFGGAWVPGLLQSKGYIEALYRTLHPELTGAEVRRVVKFRMDRKKVLVRRKDPLRLTAIVDESVLRRPVGGPAVMREQLEALRDAALRPAGNVTVRLLPFSAGMHGLLAGDLTVLRFEQDEDVVLAEGHTAQGFEERPLEVAGAIALFESALKLTIGGRELAGRLTEAVGALDRSASQPAGAH